MARVEANMTNPSPMSMFNRTKAGKPTSMKNAAAKSDNVMVIWKLSTRRPCLSILYDWFFFYDHSSRGMMRMTKMLLRFRTASHRFSLLVFSSPKSNSRTSPRQ